MADRIILLAAADSSQAQRIIDDFAEATGLERQPVDGGYAFSVSGAEHALHIIRTLNAIDLSWPTVIELGDPRTTAREDKAAV